MNSFETSPSYAYVIPAYQPDQPLLDVVQSLRRLDSAGLIVVINDGSASTKDSIFQTLEQIPSLKLLRHYVNQGKGAALKTAFNHLLCGFPNLKGVVTLDADGQHSPENAVMLAESFLKSTKDLHLGARSFSSQQKVPLRSRFGNVLTAKLFKFFTGQGLGDTQTGLRAIPRGLMKSCLKIPSQGYEFEMNMLLVAIQEKIRIIEIPIETIYINGNQSSHFNPLLDSIKIYYVFLRFLLSSLLSAGLDLVLFYLFYFLFGTITAASICSRIISATFNFYVSKRMVFLSKSDPKRELVRYAALALVLLFTSNSILVFVNDHSGFSVYALKPIVESALFIVSFIVQRSLVFASREESQTVDDE